MLGRDPVQPACMADPTQADRIEAAVSSLASDFAATRATLQTILTREITMANTQDTNQQILQAALDALNTTTSQESALLASESAAVAQVAADQAANGPKLDAIQALITNILSTTGVPQSVLDEAAALQASVAALVASSTANGAALATVQTNTTAQAARLDALARDPRDPVPVPPPVAPPVA